MGAKRLAAAAMLVAAHTFSNACAPAAVTGAVLVAAHTFGNACAPSAATGAVFSL